MIRIGDLLMFVACGVALASFAAVAEETRLVPPENWLEAASPGAVQCPEGLDPQLSQKEYRKFGERNQVWPQENIVEADWKAGKVLKRPTLAYPRDVEDLPDMIMADVHVLVGANGQILDAVVRCTNVPSLNDVFLGLARHFKFRPTQYKGRDVVTVFPVSLKVTR